MTMKNSVFCILLIKALSSSFESSQGSIYQYFPKELQVNPEESSRKLLRFLSHIKTERNFDSFILINENDAASTKCQFEDIFPALSLPGVLLKQNAIQKYRFEGKFSSEILTMICAKNYEGVLKVFDSRILMDFKSQRYIVQFSEENNRTLLKKFCEGAFRRDIFNVVIIFENYYTFPMYRKCRKYPKSKDSFYTAVFNRSGLVYENPFSDFYGENIAIFPDQQAPFSMVYVDRNGEFKLLGYFGKLIQTFAQRYNATLYYPIEIELKKILQYQELRQMIDVGILDIGLTSISLPIEMFDKGLTYPYDIVSFCFMTPLAQNVPFNQVFFMIMSPYILGTILMLVIIYGVLLLYTLHGRSPQRLSIRDVLINDKSIRGILGQPYPMPMNLNFNAKLVCFQLCYASLIINTMYQAYLHSFFTHPPHESFISNADDIEAAGLQVLLPEADFNFLTDISYPLVVQPSYHHIIRVIQNYTEFKLIRRTLDTRYVYPVSTVRWLAYNEQQAYFKRKLFFYNENFCVQKMLLLGIPVREHLPYRDLLDRFILRIQDAGFFQLWRSQNFFDLVRLQMSSFDDLSHFEGFAKSMQLDDYYWIGCIYCFCLLMSLLTFVGEHIIWNLRAR